MKRSLIAGLLIRRAVRRQLLANDIKFTEDKGFIDSVFYLDCDDATFNSIKHWVNRVNQPIKGDK
jgi:hypothetical protein